MKSLKLALAAALALAARGVVAQSAAAPAEPAPAAASPEKVPASLNPTTAPSPQAVPVAPAPQAATAAAVPTDKVTSDFSGWLILQSFYNEGGLNAMDLPKLATTAADKSYASESSTGFMVRQSRFRWNLGLPSDGYLGGATLKGLAEFDFAGQQVSDISSWAPRIRHAFVTATWKDLNNLQVLVGQTWGVAPGPYFAESITHIVMPRFGGAGFLFRRAPQVRVSGNIPVAEGAGLTLTAAALTPDTAEGQRAGMPHLEGRVSANYKQAGKQLADVGVYGHLGKKRYETYDVTGPTATDTKSYDGTTVNSRLVGVDAKISIPYVSIVGGVFTGQNIDTTFASTAPGVGTTSAWDPTDAAKCYSDPADYGSGKFCTVAGQGARKQATVFTSVQAVKTKGFFAQASITPVKGVALVGGYGQEKPNVAAYQLKAAQAASYSLDPTATNNAQILKNAQISGGVHLNLTSKWRVGVEYTQYSTEYTFGEGLKAGTRANETFKSKQLEVGTLFAF